MINKITKPMIPLNAIANPIAISHNETNQKPNDIGSGENLSSFISIYSHAESNYYILFYDDPAISKLPEHVPSPPQVVFVLLMRTVTRDPTI